MEPRIPLPTDNIFKFYALLGIVLLVSALVLNVYAINSTNELAFSVGPELTTLESIAKPTPIEITRKELIQRRLQIATANRDEYKRLSLVMFALSILAMLGGFFVWHFKIQPRQDKLLDLQIEKAELELSQMRQVRCSKQRR